jgi:hypothetical protein
MKFAAFALRLLATIASASIGAAAIAAEWEPVTDTETAVYFLDRSSLSAVQDRKRAWIMVTGPYGESLRDYGSRTQLMIFDCANGALALKEYILHARPGGQGAVLRTEIYEDNRLDFTHPGPGSVGAQLLAAVCSR